MTTKAKHTPGPWRRNGHTSIESKDRWIASTDSGGVKGFSEDVANAHLIAAAPELLEALKAALPHLQWANIHGSRCDEQIAQTQAAIAKAEGGGQ